MKYTRESKIVNLIEVVNFFEHLLYEKKLLFHPDDDFREYVQNEDGTATISSDEAEIFNQLMDQSFSVCEEKNMEIYSIGLASMRRFIKPDVQDPIEVGLLARRRGNTTIYKVLERRKGGYVLTSLSDDISVCVQDSDIIII